VKYPVEMGSDGLRHVPSFMPVGSGIQVILSLLHHQFERLQCWYAVEMASCGLIDLPGFMMIGTGVQAILRFYPSNLRGCNVDITEGICEVRR
jgi:hypothetical protein